MEITDVTSPSDPREIWGGYEFKSLEGAEVDIHMRIYPHTLLEGLRDPEIGRGSRALIDGIPKLRRPVAFEKETMVYGWGFHVRQSLSMPKILTWVLIIMVLGLRFIPFFPLLSSIAILFTLFIFRLGGHTELRL